MNFMQNANNNISNFWDGFFYFFGFMDNPATKMTKDMMKDSAATKIKKDFQTIRKDVYAKFKNPN
jgi:hypothetical protein